MDHSKISIHDLYEGAYLLCRGFQLGKITILGSNGKKLCAFTFEGEGAQRASDEYREGRATANVALLKFTMEKLKDRMFEKIREQEQKEHKKCSVSGMQRRSNRPIRSRTS